MSAPCGPSHKLLHISAPKLVALDPGFLVLWRAAGQGPGLPLMPNPARLPTLKLEVIGSLERQPRAGNVAQFVFCVDI